MKGRQPEPIARHQIQFDIEPGAHLVYHPTPGEDQVAMNRPMRDRFRCPEEFLNFRIAGELSTAPSFFQLGAETTCYGRTLQRMHAEHSKSSPADATSWISSDDGRLKLPFDLNEIIDNLRLERYPGCRFEWRERTLKSAYYRLRPFTNRWLRSRIQKLRAAGWQRRCFPQ
jgi:hypothetical protein